MDADLFEAQRDRLHAVAYRMLGSHADAEDAVQEAWLRLSRQDAATIGNLGGWLTTVVGRISLDVLRSRRTAPLLVTLDRPAPETEPGEDDLVGTALLVVLESLRPDERLAFVLHDLFAVPFDEIATILGRSTAATKMLASRARRKVRTPSSPPGPARAEREVVRAFLAAAREGDFEALLRVLDPEVRLVVDTPSGLVVTLGATRVAGTARLGAAAAAGAVPVLVGGRVGFVSWRAGGGPLSVLAFTVGGGRITAIDAIVDPAKLARLDLPDSEERPDLSESEERPDLPRSEQRLDLPETEEGPPPLQ